MDSKNQSEANIIVVSKTKLSFSLLLEFHNSDAPFKTVLLLASSGIRRLKNQSLNLLLRRSWIRLLSMAYQTSSTFTYLGAWWFDLIFCKSFGPGSYSISRNVVALRFLKFKLWLFSFGTLAIYLAFLHFLEPNLGKCLSLSEFDFTIWSLHSVITKISVPNARFQCCVNLVDPSSLKPWGAIFPK